MPATYEEIKAFMQNPNFNHYEKWVVQWQFRMLGGFETSLAETIALADDDNKDLLSRAYPGFVGVMREWQHGTLAERVRATGLAI